MIAQFRPQEAVLISLRAKFDRQNIAKTNFGENCIDFVLVDNFVGFRGVFSDSLLAKSSDKLAFVISRRTSEKAKLVRPFTGWLRSGSVLIRSA